MTDEQKDKFLEIAAERLYDEDSIIYGGFYIAWKDVSKFRRNSYIRRVKVVLDAAVEYNQELAN